HRAVAERPHKAVLLESLRRAPLGFSHEPRLQHGADPDAPVTHAFHLAHAAVEEAFELSAEAETRACLRLVTPLRELRAVLASIRTKNVALAEVRHRLDLGRQLEDHECLGRDLPAELERAAGDPGEAEADRRADLEVVADEHARAEADGHVVR